MVHSRKKKATSKKQTDSAAKVKKKTAGVSETREHPSTGIGEIAQSFKRIFGEVVDYSILLLDPAGVILTFNIGAEKTSGYAGKELIGKNCRIFCTREDKDLNRSEKLMEEARSTGHANSQGWWVRKDGTRFWGSVTLTALHNEDGDITGFLKLARDLTEKKTAEDNYSNFVEELKIRIQELEERQGRYQKMLSEVVDYAIILLDKDGKILDWNKGAEKLKGYTATEVIGKNFRLFYPREEKESKLPERLLAEAVRKGSVTHEGWRLRRNGQRFWGGISITALHDDHGGIMGFSKFTRDLTDKKIAEEKVSNVLEELRQANERLKQSEERYQRMIAEVRDYAIILLNRQGDIQNWNAGAELIKGYSAAEAIGNNFRIFYTNEDREKRLPESLLKHASKHGRAIHEGWRVRKDGSLFWGSVVITALHNPGGGIIGFSKVTRDLTEKKTTEDQMKANAAQLDLKNKTLERLNEELSSFSHVASHDLKEPLRKIRTFVNRIEEIDFAPDKSREYLQKVKVSAERMQKLIDDLLSYSQVSNETGKFERTDLNKILETVMNDLEVAINEKQVIIASDRLPVVKGIHFQLHQLFLNLLSNAIKFSKPGTTPRVWVKAEIIRGPDIPGDGIEGTNKYHHISVTDNGIGFDHQYSDRIFEAFLRLHTRKELSGTGIGLAIVKRIIENHNGIISAEGASGKGATFHLYLPVQK